MLWTWSGKLSLCVSTHCIQSLCNILAHLGSSLSSDMRALLYPQPLLSFGLDVSHRTHMSSDEKTLSQQHRLAGLLLSVHNLMSVSLISISWYWTCHAPSFCHRGVHFSTTDAIHLSLAKELHWGGRRLPPAIADAMFALWEIGYGGWGVTLLLCVHIFLIPANCVLNWRLPGIAQINSGLLSFEL